MHVLVHPCRHIFEHARLRDHTHTQHDTHDEEYLLQRTVLECPGCQALRHLVGVHQLTVHHLVDHPEHAQHTEST